MTTWTQAELNKIGTAEELKIAALRADGTLRQPVTIWVVRLGGDLFVRSVKGHNGAWFRGAQVRHEGHIQAGGIEKDVAFEDIADPGIITQVDAAYQSKYRRYPSAVAPMLEPEARSATLKLIPRK